MTKAKVGAPILFEALAIKSVSGTTRDSSDGRIANRLRNREHVIDTFIELVNEGEESTLDQVIERSGVARRSIYRYFDDLSDLSMQVFRRVSEEAAGDAVLDNPGFGPLPERILSSRQSASIRSPKHMHSDCWLAAVWPISTASETVSLLSPTSLGYSSLISLNQNWQR